MSRRVSTGFTKATAAKETIFTVPTGQIGYWTLLFVANVGANNKIATVYWYDKSLNEEFAITSRAFNSGEGVEWGGNGKYVVLDEEDEIRVEIEDDLTTFTFIVSLELEQRLALQFNNL